MKKNIIITGFMGTGKTTVGQRVAQELGWQFFDLDHLIEEKEEMTISEIFQKKGESYFRLQEGKLFKAICPLPKTVIATGGGTLIYPDNHKLAQENGIVFCLSANPIKIAQRLQGCQSRPLLKNNSLESNLNELLKAREPIYKSLSNQIDTSSLTPEQVTKIILEKYGQTLNENNS